MSAGSGLLRRASVADPAWPHPDTFVTLDGVPYERVFAFDADEGWVERYEAYVEGVPGFPNAGYRLERRYGRVAAYHHRPRWWPA